MLKQEHRHGSATITNQDPPDSNIIAPYFQREPAYRAMVDDSSTISYTEFQTCRRFPVTGNHNTGDGLCVLRFLPIHYNIQPDFEGQTDER